MEFMGRFVTDLGATGSTGAVAIGNRLGLYRALAAAPATPQQLAERTGAKIRKSLESYSASYLRFVWSLSAGVACTTYSLWAFDMGRAHTGPPWSTISIAPFVMAILRYAVDVDGGLAGEPEEIALKDRVLQLLLLAWIGTIGAAVFLG